MARRGSTKTPDEPFVENIVDIDVADEMQGSFLEYAYSVIYSRALPDARDGLKPVQRRILFGMSQMGLTPERGHVKSSRVVGDVMGKLHPHGDTAIYDALVRMAQPFSMRVPLIDGHGNFGSLDDLPAAMRYTECRMAPTAVLMTTSLDEDVVDFGPNYDDRETEPGVLPAAFPNLLVNGAAGIAVGMATNMAPHNLGEVIAATRHLIKHPKATLEDLMRFVPGPDLPTGGKIVGLDGIRDAYETGRGSFRTRATARIENVTARKKGIVVTELPYNVGPEKIIEKISDLVRSKKLQGISDITDLTDGEHGLQVVIEVKNGFHPEAILEQLYRLTPMEDSFGINNVALVDGQPRTLGLRELLTVYVEHRLEVVRRRTEYRRRRAMERAHVVEGLLIALDAIDDVIHIIRSSADVPTARERLIEALDLSDIQAQVVLDMQLRRLAALEVTKLREELAALLATIDELTAILENDNALRKLVSDELAEVAKKHATPRRTVLLESSGQTTTSAAVPLEVADEPCHVLLSSSNLLARTADDSPLPTDGGRAQHDVITSVVTTTARADVGIVTSRGRVVRLAVLDLPALPPTASSPSLAGGGPLHEFVSLDAGERALCLVPLDGDGPAIALGTAQGVVKRVTPEIPSNKDSWDVVSLKDGDEVVGAALAGDDDELVFVTTDAQLLHFSAAAVRPQGRSAGGMAGVRVGVGARVVFFGVLPPSAPDALVVTVSGSSDALPGTEPGAGKVTPFAEYPGKGRGTGGVRAHRLLKGEDGLLLAWVGPGPARAATPSGGAADLPAPDGRRDGSGVQLTHPVQAVAGPVGSTR
jgi:DNA gyrase subunit A